MQKFCLPLLTVRVITQNTCAWYKGSAKLSCCSRYGAPLFSSSLLVGIKHISTVLPAWERSPPEVREINLSVMRLISIVWTHLGRAQLTLSSLHILHKAELFAHRELRHQVRSRWLRLSFADLIVKRELPATAGTWYKNPAVKSNTFCFP